MPPSLLTCFVRALALVTLSSAAARGAQQDALADEDPTPSWARRAREALPAPLPAPSSTARGAPAAQLSVTLAPPAGVAPSSLAGLVVEVLVERRPGDPEPWLAHARADDTGVARFDGVPDGRAHALVVVDPERVPFVPDPARYALLFEAFAGGRFPHLALDERVAPDGGRVGVVVLAPAPRAAGKLEGAPDAPESWSPARAWVASPGWLQLAAVAADGGFVWRDPRLPPAGPFDPAAPSERFLERVQVGALDPPAGFRPCAGLPAPPVDVPLVLELATDTARTLASRPAGADGAGPAVPIAHADAAVPRDLAALSARWVALAAVPQEDPAGRDVGSGSYEERRALARELLAAARRGASRSPTPVTPAPPSALEVLAPGPRSVLVAALEHALAPPSGSSLATESPIREVSSLDAAMSALVGLALEWRRDARGAGSADAGLLSEVELARLDAAAPLIRVLLADESAHTSAPSALQLWCDVVAPRAASYAAALAGRHEALRAPRRAPRRAPFAPPPDGAPADVVLAALRRRPAASLGADLAAVLPASSASAAAALVDGFLALAADPARGAAVQSGALDVALALSDAALVRRVLAATTPRDEDLAGSVPAFEAAVARFAPRAATARALATLADDTATAPDRVSAMLVAAALEPEALARAAEARPELAPYAAAALLLGPPRLDVRGLPAAFAERVLR